MAIEHDFLGAVGEVTLEPIVGRPSKSNGWQRVEEARVRYFVKCFGYVEK